MEFAGQVAVVTGAARGIGKAIAEAFAQRGAAVALLDIDAHRVAAAAMEISQCGAKTIAVSCNVSLKPEVVAAIERSVETFGRIDILVNNAGHLRAGSLLDTDEELWDRTFAVNTKGVYLVSQVVVPHMIAQGGGKIVNIASNGGVQPRIALLAYCASKAAVIHLTRLMALELARHRIYVNCVCPGTTETEMQREIRKTVSVEQIIRGDPDSFRLGIPLGKIARPEDQAAAVCFLASNAANHITGQMLLVDGGHTMFGG